VKTKVRVMPDKGIPTWCGGDLVILLVFPPGCQSCCYCNVMIEVSFLIDCGRNGRPAIWIGGAQVLLKIKPWVGMCLLLS